MFANGAASAAMAYAVGHFAGDSNFTNEDRRAAAAADSIYGDDTGGLLRDLGVAYDPNDGFAASLTVDESGYILAFRGSDGAGDWPANFRQGLGLGGSQYRQARTLAIAVHKATGGNVLFVGHSLGGGLASAAAIATGGRAITFNAAGLHPFTISGAHGGIRAHYIRGDIVSMLQDFTPLLLPNAVGTRIPHSGTGNIFRRHDMSQFMSF